jgi:hypothetical protein
MEPIPDLAVTTIGTTVLDMPTVQKELSHGDT